MEANRSAWKQEVCGLSVTLKLRDYIVTKDLHLVGGQTVTSAFYFLHS